MRTSLSNIKQIELFLEGKMSTTDALVFEAKILLNANLREQVQLQERATSLIHLYGRKRLRAEIEKVHHDIFNAESNHFLKKRIRSLFIKS